MQRIGKLVTKLITQDEILDFSESSQGNGVLSLTIQNIGNATLILEDGSMQEILPDDAFVVECDIPIINPSVRVSFKREAGKDDRRAVVRYIYEVCTENIDE